MTASRALGKALERECRHMTGSGAWLACNTSQGGTEYRFKIIVGAEIGDFLKSESASCPVDQSMLMLGRSHRGGSQHKP